MSIRVLVVDDSLVMRTLLTTLIASAPDMEVVGSAPDAERARALIKTAQPDVLTLDVQMPKMDGLEFLEKLMRLHPMPVVMVSAFTQAGSETTLKALELGAVDFISKPRAETALSLTEYTQELLDKLRAAKSARLRRPARAPETAVRPAGRRGPDRGKVVVLGASTGGTEAIKEVLLGMPADCPPILIVQHMPENFTASFAARLDHLCAPTVREAAGGEKPAPGTVYIAPGHSHLYLVRGAGGQLVTALSREAPVNRHRPSVDVLFESAAALLGPQAVGVLLTGMGKDGAQGLLHLRQAGAHTLAQDEASCVVYGMPREAFMIGAAAEVVPLDQMATRILAACGRD